MRNLRCRVGDLAIVTKCPVAERIGLFVRVVAARPTEQHDWSVEFIGAPVAGVVVGSAAVHECRVAAAFDWNLTPIRGEAASRLVASREVAHV